MALKLGTGGEQYTPMARAIIGGLTSSVLFTIFTLTKPRTCWFMGKRNAMLSKNPGETAYSTKATRAAILVALGASLVIAQQPTPLPQC